MRSDSGDARWEFKVSDLLVKLMGNKNLHTIEAAEARRGYYEKAVKELNKLLDKAIKVAADDESTGKVDTYVDLRFPEDHTKDYDRIIDILEMTNAETVKLTLSEFDKYVRDNWEWTELFKTSSKFYNG